MLSSRYVDDRDNRDVLLCTDIHNSRAMYFASKQDVFSEKANMFASKFIDLLYIMPNETVNSRYDHYGNELYHITSNVAVLLTKLSDFVEDIIQYFDDSSTDETNRYLLHDWIFCNQHI